MIHFTLVSTDLPTQIQFVQCKWRLHRFSRARFVALVLHLLRRRMKGLAWGDKWRKRNECFGQLFVCIDGNGQHNSSLQDQCYLLLHKQLVRTSKRWILRDHRIFRFISTMVVPMEFHYLLSTNPMLRWMLCGIVGARLAFWWPWSLFEFFFWKKEKTTAQRTIKAKFILKIFRNGVHSLIDKIQLKNLNDFILAQFKFNKPFRQKPNSFWSPLNRKIPDGRYVDVRKPKTFSSFRPHEETVFILHGFNGTARDTHMRYLKDGKNDSVSSTKLA